VFDENGFIILVLNFKICGCLQSNSLTASTVYWEVHKVKSAAQIISNPILTSGLTFAKSVRVNCSYGITTQYVWDINL